ncbi:MAG: 2-isopropylmalate synthase [Deltaproteobacteria bacterium]|nr:2-isopropylmalate synthase [Deltaproteobacteria bacterium]NIS76862.1 2-isopropylmalate synthase [Deltaproteobacteria bacterium]
MAERVFIFDTTLRDGEQVPGAKLAMEQKLEIAKQLAVLKVDVIEAGFPVSSPGDFEAVSAVAREVKGPVIAGLCRVVKKDIEVAWEAVRNAERPRIHTFVGTSDIHIQKKFRADRDRVFDWAVDAVKFAKSLCPDVEFSTEDASRTDFDYLCRTIEAVIKAGATVINVPDTVGYAIPEEFGERIRRLRERVPALDKVILSVHCHNDLGLASANTLAAIKNGARQVEVTVNGVGERAGNCSMEEVVMALRTRKDFIGNYTTGINAKEIYKTSRMVSNLMGLVVQPNKAIVGSNAFAHSSGIHQDGILKDRATYEIVKPEDVGVSAHQFVLTARSGRHAVKDRIKELGYTLTDTQFGNVFDRFIEIADKKKEVMNEDLSIIIEEELFKIPETYRLRHVQILSASQGIPMAALKVVHKNRVIDEASTGNGPIDAAYKCVERIVKRKFRLVSFNLNAVTSGKDAVGDATVRVRANGSVYLGRATSTDIIEAAIKAYIAAINKAIYFEEKEKKEKKPAAKKKASARTARKAKTA